MANRSIPRLLQTPAVVLLLIWMLVPLSMTLYFSFIRYVLNNLRRPEWTTPSLSNWRGWGNYEYVLNAKDFLLAIQNSVLIVGGILVMTVILGLGIAVLVNRNFPGRGIVRVLLISPFFVMPAVNAVLWINMLLDPVLGLQGIAVGGLNNLIEGLRDFPLLGSFFSLWPEIEPISFRATQTSAYAVIMMVTWQWTPFAVLIFMTSLQSEDESQKEAATLDGASPWSQFVNLTIPHLARPIAIVVMIQSIFHLSLYAEIEIVSRGNGNKNLPYLIGEFSSNNIGAASATGIFAVILANIIAIFLLRMVGKSLMD
ncbi:carbohydrate ABC transporter permease [Thalassobium sp. R2A62]|jgi:sorbitol/mannitol transport system permease protein|uniref:carbohydrate ABC transporter permease n=1 Tax=Thalassobium sp. R2A62 TaxID=633131 RepID=UPI0001B1CAB2|nr:sugar ABC transporter permease [Thalassobium sp. R2A62]EET47337.1 putative sorbitol/mannitol ABC transporter, permease protein [Thalassobium sp. R2A62]MDG1339582.1 sugar ABC transporter permease [Paracoccaceae bacterium]MDG2453957.1 sugar ABC transporter permease [Paracoccaceae bacterium]